MTDKINSSKKYRIAPLNARLLVLLIAGFILSVSSAPAELDDSEVQAIQDGFDGRRDAMWNVMRSNPFPADNPSDTQIYVWHRLAEAFAEFHLRGDLAKANTSLQEICQRYVDDPNFIDFEFGMHWQGNQIARAFIQYEADLDPATRSCLIDTMWAFSHQASEVDEAEVLVSNSWHIEESENHHIQRFATHWAFSQILKDEAPYSTMTYDDGHTPEEHFLAWTEYSKVYLRERARKGFFVEAGSPTYAKYTLLCIYSMHDFAEDPELRDLAKIFLDLYWASFAQEQIEAVRGGGKSRAFEDETIDAYGFADAQMAWYYLEQGPQRNRHPAVAPISLSDYRWPDVVVDIARDTDGRGSYHIENRNMGLAEAGFFAPPYYQLRQGDGGILRKSYVTPGFVIGAPMLEALPQESWARISSQSRWQGVILSGSPNSRIYPRSEGLNDKKVVPVLPGPC